MRRARVVSLGLLTLLASLTGCLNDRAPRSASLLNRVGIGGPSGPDAVYIDYAVIERPAGNPDINRQVWTNIDEMIVDTETRALLTENGFRVGVVGGLLPSELDAMIANPKSETALRRWKLYVNNPAGIKMNGPIALAEYKTRAAMNAQPATVKFEQARFSMNFTPSFTSDGRISLRCVPEMEYLDKKHWLPTGAVATSWLGNRPVERYDSLAFDVKLAPGEYLVIGSIYERGPWIGNEVFGGSTGNQNVQRLLVVRAGRLEPSDPNEDSANAQGKDKIVPLAGQTLLGASRGSRPQ